MGASPSAAGGGLTDYVRGDRPCVVFLVSLLDVLPPYNARLALERLDSPADK